MLKLFARLMVWWFRKWYPVFRFVGRQTGNETYIETSIKITEENIERIWAAIEEDE
ncbi:hypothetical protein [Halobacterium salinarum]|nr:hypothetical protein [Halobacterium salinarum]MDL0126116.1 hypothetical protein [Halobacterium salinarum]MDL0145597.1 hypothetical protein [Halobacterium salinarum]